MRRSLLCAVSVSVSVFGLLALGPAAAPAHAQGLPYPSYSPYEIKGIGAEVRDQWLWGDMLGNHTGGMVTNIPWVNWQPWDQAAPCGMNQELYQSRCFTIDAALDNQIKTFSDAGVLVTGILVTVPGFARLPCSNPNPAWCGNANNAAFGRFAGFLAHRYNGQNGHGRIVNFVIHNEVNSAWAYYSDSCGEPGKPACSVFNQVSRYAADYMAAYDAIKAEQAAAKVLVSLTGYFNGADNPGPGGGITLKTYLSSLVPFVGLRKLQMALHAYNQDINSPAFSLDDNTQASIGAIGKVTGWLRYTFPTRPEIWEIHLTEQGLRSPLTNDAAQADWLCQAYRNILGTPGVESFHYTPPTSHAGYAGEELVWCSEWTSDPDGAGPLQAGYCNTTTYGTTWRWRAAWATWALSNRIDISPPILSCGFENLPYVKFSRYSSPRGHFATTRAVPVAATYEGAWRLLRSPAPGTHLLYECKADSGGAYQPGGHSFIDAVNPCPSWLVPWGPLGYAYNNPGPGLVPLNRCYVNAPGYEDHFITSSPTCEGWVFEETLGYAPPF